MHPVPRRFRVAQALRRLLPANPLQTIFLLAAVCLSACVGRTWLVVPSMKTLDAIAPLSMDDFERWVRVTVVFAFPLLIAGIGAYFCCFFRRENPVRSWLGFAIAPALLGIAGGLFLPPLIVLNSRHRSIFDTSGHNPFHSLKFPLRALFVNSGTGFQLAVLGLFLAFLGGWLLKAGRVSLPLKFDASSSGTQHAAFDPAVSRQRVFAIYALALFGFVGNVFSWPLSSVLIRFFNNTPSNQLRHSFSSWFSAAQFLAYVLPLFLLAVWTLGKNRRNQLLEMARFPPVRILGLAIALPIIAHWLPHVLAYAVDRVAWAQHWSATPDVPYANLYLRVPSMGPYLVLYAFAAVLSEWCWRGCMQPQFVRTFGVYRGFFLLGILYGSAQFLLFPAVLHGLPDFFLHLILQLLWGIIWSINFGWLTLSGGSAWPAAIWAASSSILTQAAMSDVQEIIPRRFLRLSLLGSGCVIAFLLVRYLPLASERSSASVETPQDSQSVS